MFIVIINDTGCDGPTSTVRVTVGVKPVLTSLSDNICEDPSIIITATNFNEDDILQWYKNGEKLLGENHFEYVATDEGIYTVKSVEEGDELTWGEINFNLSSTSVPLNEFESIFFINDNIGWIKGYEEIYKTYDGGKSWIDKSPDFGRAITDLQFVNEYVGFLSTAYTIYKTVNGGDSWEDLYIDNLSYYFNFHFLNENIGWYVNRGAEEAQVIYKTTDGGLTWTEISFQAPGVESPYLFKVYFVTEDLGFVQHSDEEIFKTIDGGSSWIKINGPDYYNKIKFITPTTGYLNSWRELYKSTDGGDTWELINENSYSFDFLDENHGITIRGNISEITTDGGQTWETVSIERESWFEDIAIKPNEDAMAIGEDLSLFELRPIRYEGCESEPIIIETNLSAPVITTSSQEIFLGEEITLNTSGCENGTVLWSNGLTGVSISFSPSVTNNYSAICIQNTCRSDISNEIEIVIIPTESIQLTASSQNVCLGDDVTITVQGCENGIVVWSDGYTGPDLYNRTIVNPTDSFSLSAYCQNIDNEGKGKETTISLAVGQKPVISSSGSNLCEDDIIYLEASGFSEGANLQWFRNGYVIEGANSSTLEVAEAGDYSVSPIIDLGEYAWEMANEPYENYFDKLSFVTEFLGLAINYNTIFKTVDGGKTWEEKYVEDYLTAIKLLSENIGYAITEYGKLLKTTNSGEDWEEVLNKPSAYFYDIYFQDETNGWLYGYNTLFKTEDGGLTWTEITESLNVNNSEVTSVNFLNNYVGFVGISSWYFDGLLLTRDGGQTWETINSPSSYIKSINAFTSLDIIVSADDGVYRTINGGGDWQFIAEESETIHFFNINEGYIHRSWSDQIDKTFDGGKNWIAQEVQTTVYGFDFIESGEGWANGSGVVYNLSSGLSKSCESDIISIFDNIPDPVITIHADRNELCAYEEITVTATGCEGGVLEWNNGSIGESATYYLSSYYTSIEVVCVKNQCRSSAWDLIEVKSIPEHFNILANKPTIFHGDEVSMEIMGCDNGNITWEDGFEFTSRTLSPEETTTYRVDCETDGCYTFSEVTITVLPKPYAQIGSGNICADGEVEVIAYEIPEGGSVQWFKDGLELEGETRDTLIAKGEGEYSFVLNYQGEQIVWEIKNLPVQFTSINFADTLKGYATNWNEIYVTTDGGITWQLKYETPDLSEYLGNIKIFENEVYVYSKFNSEGVIIKSINGGDTWFPINIDTPSSISVVDKDNLWYSTDEKVMWSNNGGSTWAEYPIPILNYDYFVTGFNARSIEKAFIQIFLADTHTYEKYQTFDEGASWELLQNGLQSDINFSDLTYNYAQIKNNLYLVDENDYSLILPNVSNFDFISENEGYVTLTNGNLLITKNGGITWSYINNVYRGPVAPRLAFTYGNYGMVYYSGESEYYKFSPELLISTTSDPVTIEGQTLEPPVVVNDNIEICESQVVLDASCTSGPPAWYNSDGDLLGISESYLAQVIGQGIEYFVKCVADAGETCASTSTKVTVSLSGESNTEILAQPEDIYICEDMDVGFVISVSNPNAQLQWQINDGEGWANILDMGKFKGANSDTLFITKPGLAMNGYQLQCVVIDNCSGENIESTKVNLIVNEGASTNNVALDGPLIGAEGRYIAASNLTSSGQISGGSNVEYNSGGSINLEPGFEVLPGSTFSAIIVGTCSTSPNEED